MDKTKRLPKGKVTVDKLLQMDDVNGIISYLTDNKHKVKDVCCVIQTDDEGLELQFTNMPLYEIVAMLEMAKLLLVQQEWFGLEAEE